MCLGLKVANENASIAVLLNFLDTVVFSESQKNILCILIEFFHTFTGHCSICVCSKLIGILEKNERKIKELSETERERLRRLDGRKRAFLDRIPENEDVDFNVSIFRNPTAEQVLKENGRYGIHNVYR